MTSKKVDATFKVRTLFDCGLVEDYGDTYNQDPLWVQTLIGCRLLLILQHMYGFNMTYVIPDTQSITEEERILSVYPQLNDSIDIYAKPISFTSQMLESSCPIGAVYTWRYGFILKRPNTAVLRKFYSLPFTTPVWYCLNLMILMVSGIFFYLSRWEQKMLGGYSSYHYELLMAFGACCQHILPMQTNMLSRRMAYLSFILGVFVINCFYSSNLLSHLVSDKDSTMDLETLADSDYECVKLGIYNAPTQYKIYEAHLQPERSRFMQKKKCAKNMNIIDGLNAVITTKTALLSDYAIVNPFLIKMFDTDVVCKLIQIDLYSNIKKYFYTSKNFEYKSQFKVGLLRVKETGILQKVFQLHSDGIVTSLNCAYTYPMRAEFDQIAIPLAILLGCYVVATVIMLLERWHCQENHVWPYVD